MMSRASLLLTLAISTLVHGLHYDPDFDQYNLNKAQDATSPLKYWGERGSFTYTPSPQNWRFPVYTLFLDRWVNGDPTNDNANGTLFEHDPNSNQMRHGGDLQGLVDSLDYIQGMGIKAIYIAGSIFINQPWGADSYSVSVPSHPHFNSRFSTSALLLSFFWASQIDEHGKNALISNNLKSHST